MNPFLKQVPCVFMLCSAHRAALTSTWGASMLAVWLGDQRAICSEGQTAKPEPSQPLPSPTLHPAQVCHIDKSHSFLILCCFSSLRCFLPSFIVACATVLCIKRKPLYIVEEKLRNLNENTCSASEH